MGACAVVAVVLRAWCFLDRRETGAFSQLVDTIYYVRRAREIFLFGPLPADGIFMSPLYPYLVAITGGAQEVWSRLVAVQIGLATVAVCLTVWAVRSVMGTTPAVFAGAVLAAAPPLVFFDTTVLADGPATQACAIAAAALALHRTHARLFWLALAGSFMALGVALRPNLVLLPLAVAIVSWARKERWISRDRSRHSVLLFGPTVLVLLAIAAVNASTVGKFYPLPWNGGFNLFAGNNPGATGEYSGYGLVTTSDPTASAPVERALGRRPSPPEIDAHWREKAIAFVLANPAAAARLFAKKAALFFQATESPQNEDLELERVYSAALGLGFMNFGILAGLSAVGLVALRRHPEGWPWLAVAAVAFVTCVAFFVNGRLRLPAWAGLAPVAGAGVARVIRMWRQRSFAPLAVAMVAVGAIGTVSSFAGRKPTDEALAMYRYAVLEALGGRSDLAEAWLARADRLRVPASERPVVMLERAAVLASLERPREAFDLLQEAAGLMPRNRRAQQALLSIALELKRAGAVDPEVDQAIREARRRMESLPY